MRSFVLSCALVLAVVPACGAQESAAGDWNGLIRGGKCKEARALCTPWLRAPEAGKQAEGHKCLANVELCESESVVFLQPNDLGGAAMTSSYPPEAVDKALRHLEEALKLTPQDLSIHLGRLHLLEISFRYPEMAKALDDSCSTYKGSEGVEVWLAYTSELFQQKQFRAALALLQVLDKHYPDSHQVLGNIGAAYEMLSQDEAAIHALQRAVELAPADPIDNWNLARAYDYAGKTELAEQWYKKALSLEPDAERRKGNGCLYAAFVEQKLHDRKRACQLQQANCPAEEQTACAPAK